MDIDKHFSDVLQRLKLGSKFCGVFGRNSESCPKCPYFKLHNDTFLCYQLLAKDAFEISHFYDKIYEVKKDV